MPALKNILGERFGRLTVVEQATERKGGGVVWRCKCDCGKYVNVKSGSLINSGTRSCGCYNDEIRRSQYIDISGQRFGRLLVLELAEKRIGDRKTYFKCLCDCGKEHVTNSNTLRSGSSISCGCYKDDFHREKKTTHGMSDTRIYNIWQGMIDRCSNPNNEKFSYYGGKGVEVCERWLSFVNFYEDTKEGYADDLSIDRYPNRRGNYQPDNFRWATRKQQSRNTDQNVFIEYNGQTLCRSDWGDMYGVRSNLIRERIISGWSIEKAITTPPKKINLCQHL